MDFKVVDAVKDEDEGEGQPILMCAAGKPWNDLQIGGTCSQCGCDIYWQNTAAPIADKRCMSCCLAAMREHTEETGEEPSLRVTQTAVREAAARVMESDTTLLGKALDGLKKRLAEGD